MDKARSAALAALLRVRVDEGYSNIVFDKTVRSLNISPRDTAFASALFYGVLEKRIALDYCISFYSKISLRRMEPIVQEILRMGIFQILFMDRIPDSAAVNESVNLAKQNKAVKAYGFINGILRSVLRNRNNFVWPDETTQKGKSIRYSCPEEWIDFWEKSYGNQVCGRILESLEKRPPLYIRLNPTKVGGQELTDSLTSLDVKVSNITTIEGAYALEHSGSIADLTAFQQGWFHVQDLSSQICCFLVGARPGERVIDVCAAPGGKTFTLAENMKNEGEILSFDKYKGKVRLIQQGAERLGLSIVKTGLRDASSPKEPLEKADCVLCDVPCSGLGVIRRKPEIRYKSMKELDGLPDLQYLILCESAKLVRENGRLIYSTCTLNPAENGEVANRFLRDHPDFRPLFLQLPKGISHVISEPENQITIFPFTADSDGFFVAAFQRI